MWTLSFHPDNKKVMLEEEDFMKHVQTLTESSHKEVRKAAKGTLWTINGAKTESSEYSQNRILSPYIRDYDRILIPKANFPFYTMKHILLLLQPFPLVLLQRQTDRLWMCYII